MNSNELDKNKINRVATPIKIDSMGKPIINSENKELVIVKKRETQGSLTMVFVVILLLILAFISFLIFYIIIPNNQKENDRHYKVEPTTTRISEKSSYSIVSGMISDTHLINTPGEYKISDDFVISLVNTSIGNSVLVNGVFIDNAIYLSNKIALLHDLIMINLMGNNNRTSKLYAVDLKGNVVFELFNLTDDGMLLNGDIEYNKSSINVSSSRVSGNKLILNNDYGNINGLDICNYKVLGENNIDETFSVISNYSFEYLGDHKFSKPVLVNSIPLSEYRNSSNVCAN